MSNVPVYDTVQDPVVSDQAKMEPNLAYQGLPSDYVMMETNPAYQIFTLTRGLIQAHHLTLEELV